MNIVLAQNKLLQTGSYLKEPTPKIKMSSVVDYEYAWKLNCEPRVFLKSMSATPNSIQEIERISGKMGLYMNVTVLSEKDLPQCSMFIQDHDWVLKRIFAFLGRESINVYVDIKYMDQIISFRDFHFEKEGDHSKEKIPCDLAEYGFQTLSTFRAFQLVSDCIGLDSFTATMMLEFADHGSD